MQHSDVNQKEAIMNKSVQEQVIDIIVDKFGVERDEVTLNKSFVEDLKADSLDLTDLIMAFELHFNCDISEEQAEQIRTVGDAVKYLEGVVAKQKNG